MGGCDVRDRMRRLVGAAVVGLALASCPAAALAGTMSHPLGVYIDGELVPTRIHLRFDAAPLDAPLEAVIHASGDGPAAAWAALIGAARAVDTGAARAWLDPRGMTRGTVEDALKLIAGQAGGWRDVTVVARYRLGPDEVFVYRSERPEGPATGSIAFRRSGGGQWRGRLVTSAEPALSLINEVYRTRALAPSRLRPVPQSGSTYAVPIDDGGEVVLEFDATPLDLPLNATGGGQQPTTEASAAWRDAWATLSFGDWSAFAERASPTSQRHIRDWLDAHGRSEQARRAGAALLTEGVRAVLEIEAAPGLALIVYSQGPGADTTAHVVRAAWMTRSGTSVVVSQFLASNALDVALMRSPHWPARAGALAEVLSRARRTR